MAIGGTFLFALKSILIKFAFAAGCNTMTLLALRMVLSCPFYVAMYLYLYRPRTERARPPLRASLYALILGFFGYYLASYLDMAGLEHISAQLERITLFTYPTIIAVLAWMFLRETLNARIIASLALSYLGIAVMAFQERSTTATGQVTVGVLLVLGSAVSYSLYVLFAKPLMQRIGSREFTSLAMIGSTVFVVVHFLTTQTWSSLTLSPVILLYALLLAFVCTVIPSFLINEAIVRLGATRTTIIGSVGPVLTSILAVVILQEPTSIYHLIGVVCVIVGVSLVATK